MAIHFSSKFLALAKPGEKATSGAILVHGGVDLCGQRHDGSHVRSAGIGFHFKPAVQFVQALPHPGQAYSSVRADSAKPLQSLRGNAVTGIAYFEDYAGGIVLKACSASFRAAEERVVTPPR